MDKYFVFWLKTSNDIHNIDPRSRCPILKNIYICTDVSTILTRFLYGILRCITCKYARVQQTDNWFLRNAQYSYMQK